MYWYLKVVRNYSNFTGRAPRREFWWFFLINLLITVAIGMIDSVLGTTFMMGPDSALSFSSGIITSLYNLFILLPTIAVGVRRLHDIDASGWWMLVILVPYVGALILLAVFIIPGKGGDNRFGAPLIHPSPGHPD